VRRVTQRPPAGEAALLVESPYFTTNVVDVAGTTERTLSSRDSFTVYICLAGEAKLTTAGGEIILKTDSVALIPADQDEVTISGSAQLLETYL
jgi:mannose-6-phosphate isomerase